MAGTQCSIGSAGAPRTEKTRRSWTEREEEVLLASLKELVAHGWKSDNGFRPGYVIKLEEAMKKEFPLTDLKATPHITSRLTTWKKNYSSLVSILNRSGVGFNLNGDFKVEANPDQWAQICLADNNASKIRAKGWPLYEGWKVVFGKDRATGENAEGVMDAVNEMMNEHGDDYNADNSTEDMENDVHTEMDDSSTCQSNRGASRTTHLKKKRKVDEGVQSMCDLLGEIHRDTNARLESLAARIGLPADTYLARKQVFSLINQVPGLTLKEKFKVCDKLTGRSVERLEFFMGLPDSDKNEYVIHLLSDDQ